jgi:type VI protein secretion system component VasK
VTQVNLATLGTIGIWLLVAAGLVLIVELVLIAVWGAAMSRRMLELSESISSQRAEIQADLERLRRAIEETKALWRPYQRMLRTLNHPLFLAVFASLRRRRAAR